MIVYSKMQFLSILAQFWPVLGHFWPRYCFKIFLDCISYLGVVRFMWIGQKTKPSNDCILENAIFAHFPSFRFLFLYFKDITSKRLGRISRKKKQSIRLKNIFIFVTKN